MVREATPSERAASWSSRVTSSVVALARRPEGVAALDEEGTIHLFSAAGKKEARDLEAPRGAAVDHGDAKDRATPSALATTDLGLVVGWHGGNDLAIVGEKTSARIAAGDASIDAWCARGSHLAVGRFDRIELWSKEKLAWSFELPAPCIACAITPKSVIVLDAEAKLLWLSRADGRPSGALALASSEPAWTFRMAACDEHLVVTDGDAVQWICPDQKHVIRRVRARAPVASISVDKDVVAAGLADGWVQLWEARTGQDRAAFRAHARRVTHVALTEADVVTTDGHELKASTRARATAKTAEAPVTCLAARDEVVLAGDAKGRVRVLDGGLKELAKIELGSPIVGLHVSRDGARVAVSKGEIVQWGKDGKERLRFRMKRLASASAADDAYVFIGTSEGALDVYDLAKGGHVTSYPISDDRIASLARLPGGSRIAVGTGALDGRVVVLDLANGKVVAEAQPQPDAFGVQCLAAHPNGKAMVIGSDDGAVAICDLAGRVHARMSAPDIPLSIAFEPHGRSLVVACSDGRAHAVMLRKGAQLECSPLGEGVTRVAWGASSYAGRADGTVTRLEE